jgi:hypothetical protein
MAINILNKLEKGVGSKCKQKPDQCLFISSEERF